MDRPPYLILLLVAVVMGMILIWGLYTKFFAAPETAATPIPSTQSTLLERMQDRLAATRAATHPTTSPTTPMTTAPSDAPD